MKNANRLLFLVFPFSIYSAAAVVAAAEEAEEESAEMAPLVVKGEKLTDVSSRQLKSADLAEALFRSLPGVSLVRRSGIANDIILRGQKKDNINILIDGAKIYGACPNRMDPPTSHVLSNNVESIQIIEGPYDVENFGALSGGVTITTREPTRELSGDASINFGRWGYRKGAVTLSGGGERMRALVSLSKERSEQYEDGDGNDFAQQIEDFAPETKGRYQPRFRDLDAYDKQTLMAKLDIDVAANQLLKLAYTANRSDDVQYPSSPMDALFDDSDIYTLDYQISGLGAYSDELVFQYYDSRVDHPMSNRYRLSSGPDSANEKIHHLETHAQGFKLKNSFDLDAGTSLDAGLDLSRRRWDGLFRGRGMAAKIDGFVSLDDITTENRALFLKIDRQFDALAVQAGARYDSTTILSDNMSQTSNDYHALSGFVNGTWSLNETTRLFAGVGRSSRVPDGRELYLRFPTAGGITVGTPDLDQVSNTEIDLGVEIDADSFYLKPRLFYSWLDDYIHYNASRKQNRFENVDATLYGLSLNGSWYFREDLYLDFGLAWQRGRKKQPLSGQQDKDLAEIPPLKVNLALNWEYARDSVARAEVVAADDWTRFDADNGEQLLDSWAVLNLKLQHRLTDHVELTAGVDNVFDETYAVSNTFKDMTLLLGGEGEVILLNEPGRYFYLNAAYRF